MAALLFLGPPIGSIAFFLALGSVVYGYLKRNPGTLKDPNLIRRPELQRFALLALCLFLLRLLGQLDFFSFADLFQIGSSVHGTFPVFFFPFLCFGTALFHSFAFWPKGASLSGEEADQRRMRNWTSTSLLGFMSAFVATVAAIVCWPMGLGSWASNWLIASARDANLVDIGYFTAKLVDIFGSPGEKPYLIVHAPESEGFGLFINVLLTFVLLTIFFPLAVRFSRFLLSWVKGCNGKWTWSVQSILASISAPSLSIELKRKHGFARNMAASLAWLLSCYLILFSLIGLSAGPIGKTVCSWLNDSLYEADQAKLRQPARNHLTVDRKAETGAHLPVNSGLAQVEAMREKELAARAGKAANGKEALKEKKRPRLGKTTWNRTANAKYYTMAEWQARVEWIKKHGVEANPNLRLFCAAIFALYGTVPLAVTGAVFLPYFRRRKLILDADGLFCPDGSPFILRLWSELASVEFKSKGKSKLGEAPKNGKLIFRFKKGRPLVLTLSEVSKGDLEKLLSSLDENAPQCSVAESVLELRQQNFSETPSSNTLSGTGAQALAPQFQSTIFQAHQAGTYLPDGQTRVVKQLASRPLSCVYLVRTSEGKLAIAKQFYLAENDDETQALRKCFLREYELLKSLDHKQLSKVLSVFQNDESTYLILEHARGADLRSFVLSQGARSENQVIDWALQVCDIMIYLHSQKPPVLHRDLTPDNLVLAEDGSIKIIDFGAGQRFLEGITGTIIGKQCYVPPEQLQGKASKASDIYSFGALLYFLLSGEDPTALSVSDAAKKAAVSPALNSIIKHCTAFNENGRPESFEQLKEFITQARIHPDKDLRAETKGNEADSESEPQSESKAGSESEAEAEKVPEKALKGLLKAPERIVLEKGRDKIESPEQESQEESDAGVLISTKELQEQEQ